jgi:hypothetical protein
MPVLLDCIAAEPCPDRVFIDKDHLIKWLEDALRDSEEDRDLLIDYTEDLLEYLHAAE